MIEMKSLRVLSSRRWALEPYQEYSRRNRYLDWAAFLKEVDGGTKHQREYLLGSVREFFGAAIHYSEIRRGEISAGTVNSLFAQLKTLVRWLTSQGLWRFSLIGPIDLEDYLRSRLANGKESGRSTKQTMQGHLHLVSLLWELRHKYTSPLTFDPLAYDAITALRDSGGPKGQWHPVSEDIALPLLKDALEWVQTHGSQVHCLCQQLAPVRMYGVSEVDARQAVRIALKNAERSPAGRELVRRLGLHQMPFKAAVEAAARETIGAALFACLMLTGMRISELLSLRTSFDNFQLSDGRDLPYCFITGHPAKMHRALRTWVAPRIVIDILRLIRIMNGDRWRAGGDQYVFLRRRKGSVIPPTTRMVGMMTRTTAVRYLKQFILSPARTVPCESADWFHPHRLRKTFARYVVIRNKLSLESLAYHYGHLYTAVLDGAYVGSDIGISQLLAEEDQEELKRCLTDIVTSKNLGGKAGQRIKVVLGHIDDRFKGATAVSGVVDELIREGTVVAPCDWGYCLYTPDLSACHGGAKEPNQVERNPTTCGGCSNFVVARRHRAWWEHKYAEEQSFLSREDLPVQTREVVEVRFKTTVRVLSSLVENRGTDDIEI